MEVADQMADDETEKNDPGDGHDGFFSDRGLPKTQASGGKIDRGGAHRNKSPFSEVRSLPNVWKPRSRQRFESGQVAVEDMPSPPPSPGENVERYRRGAMKSRLIQYRELEVVVQVNYQSGEHKTAEKRCGNGQIARISN